MAVWLPAQNKFYLPPTPATRVLSTDEYVTRTSIFYHASTDRLLTVGHPYYQFEQPGDNGTNVIVPKVSPNQYRVFRLRLPDPNNFAFGDKSLFDPEKERLVWAVRGLQIDRGQPLGIAVTGNPVFDKFTDAENSNKLDDTHGKKEETRFNIAMDPKQTQMFCIGCKPAWGEHWIKSTFCRNGDAHNYTDCPPIELYNTVLEEDGDMMDIGFGAMDFKNLQQHQSGVPVDIATSISKYPDYIKMLNEPYGDRCFFYVRREQLYARHIFTRAGDEGSEKPPERKIAKTASQTYPTSNYYSTPSGSLISSEGNLFNRPYWIQQAQGQNNGIAWMNQLFLTVADNTRGTPLTITIGPNGQGKEGEFKATEYKTYTRHVEEFDISIIVQLCKVSLTPENLAVIHTMNPDIIEAWHLNANPPPGTQADIYRYIDSLATKCPTSVAPTERVDPYKDFKFWEVDLTEKMTDQLDQTSLGRKFLFQTGVLQTGTKRSRLVTTSTKPRSVKRRRGVK
ncbi:major capsid protein L1 [Leopardus wiedii papillomavirus type 1]|uniref:Major capsid protein L1 n=1 Tax=Leopardus wiedii papillomavirus type 1 TaxID=2495531 RepID=A0A3S8V2P3_9PAPI|nr:major capsid protein L1 [Leopardus wiedii papillomavirus type 1]